MTKSELPHEINTWTISTYYEDNAPYCRELWLSLSIRDWYRFQTQSFFPELMKFFENLETLSSS